MRGRLRLLLGVLLLCAGAGCGEDDSAPGDALADTEWRAATIAGRPALLDVASTMNLRAGGRMDGTAGCNGYSGTWRADGDELTLEVGPMTAMACAEPVMTQEAAFVAALSATRSYRLADTLLELRDAEGRVVATFRPRERAQLVGQMWTVVAYSQPGGVTTTPLPGTTLTATFTADGRLTGSTGCNEYATTYTVNGPAIALQPAATTKKACAQPVMEQERAFLAALRQATTHELDERTLALMAADGSLLVSLEPANERRRILAPLPTAGGPRGGSSA